MFSFSLELQPLLDEGFEHSFFTMPQILGSIWVEMDRKEQQMYQKIYRNFHGYAQEKVGSTYNLAVRALRSMSC